MRLQVGRNAIGRLARWSMVSMMAFLFASVAAHATGGGKIDIEKLTNGVDADDPFAGDAPQIAPGDTVTWTYIVTNTGDVTLTQVVVLDNAGVMVSCPKTVLAPGETMSCEASGVAVDVTTITRMELRVLGVCGGFVEKDLYQNKGLARGKDPEGRVISAVDRSHYCNPMEVPNIAIDIRKQEEGEDMRTFDSGADVDFEIVVTNTGDVDLTDVVVTDVLAPDCDRLIGDLAAGASIGYICTLPGVTAGLENEACVMGYRDGVVVEDCDPSIVKIRKGGQGCTPGYWKQDQHFDSWTAPYTPGTLFGDVFEDAFPGMTLLDVAAQGGGGLKALGRHTVAALLNAASPDVSYDRTVGEVIDAFNGVFPGADGDYEALKDLFEGFNEQGCPLD